MPETTTDRTPELVDGAPLRVVHDELIRIEAHWTMQVQSQQQRIFAVLTVNGFSLAFLATAGFLSSHRSGAAYTFFCLSLISLTIALMVGIFALIPRIEIAGFHSSRKHDENVPPRTRSNRVHAFFREHYVIQHKSTLGETYWLDARRVWQAYTSEHPTEIHPAWFFRICESAAANAGGNLDHANVMARRRVILHWELTLIVLALIILVPAIVLLVP